MVGGAAAFAFANAMHSPSFLCYAAEQAGPVLMSGMRTGMHLVRPGRPTTLLTRLIYWPR